MRALRSPVTLEHRQRRQRLWEYVRQLALMGVLAAAFAIGAFVATHGSRQTNLEKQECQP